MPIIVRMPTLYESPQIDSPCKCYEHLKHEVVSQKVHIADSDTGLFLLKTSLWQALLGQRIHFVRKSEQFGLIINELNCEILTYVIRTRLCISQPCIMIV